MNEEVSRITRLESLERRDWQLWLIALLVIVSLTVTIIGIQAPQLIGAPEDLSPQLRSYIFGLSLLVLLFCAYVVQSIQNLRKIKAKLFSAETEKDEIKTLLETVRERTEKLEASDENYRVLLERNADGIVVVDLNKTVKFLNPAAEELFGRAAGEFLGEPFRFPVSHERTEIKVERPDGGIAVAEMRMIETTWEGEKVWLASLRDVTMRKQTEETLTKANDELIKLDQMKTDFVSMVSHELRTPLASIKNATNLLASGKAGEVNEEQKRFLSMTSRNIDRLAEIINDLLDLSKIEAGKMSFQFTELDLNPVIKQVVSTFQPQAATNSLVLELDCPETLPSVYADQVRIEQVLYNLLSNAIKFTSAGGRVILSARVLQEGVELSVADTGIGISSKDQEKIFDRFYQAGDSLTRTTKGTGLGLAISRELVESHGGRIELKSELGEGTCFTFTLMKFSAKTLEMADLDRKIHQYKDNPCISFFLITPGLENLENPEDGLKKLAEKIEKLLPRATDKIISQAAFGRLLLMLTGTPKKGALVVREKLEETLSKNPVMINETPMSLRDLNGPVCFPEDGKTAKDVIAKLHQSKD